MTGPEVLITREQQRELDPLLDQAAARATAGGRDRTAALDLIMAAYKLGRTHGEAKGETGG